MDSPEASNPASSGAALVALAGPMAVGKTTLATRLVTECRGEMVSARAVLVDRLDVTPEDRHSLQAGGARLEAETRGEWLAHHVRQIAPHSNRIVVDSVRTVLQLERLRFLPIRGVYLDIDRDEQRNRYAAAGRMDPLKRIPFDEAVSHRIEIESLTLREHMDLVLSTDELSADEVFVHVRGWLGWPSTRSSN